VNDGIRCLDTVPAALPVRDDHDAARDLGDEEKLAGSIDVPRIDQVGGQDFRLPAGDCLPALPCAIAVPWRLSRARRAADSVNR